MVHIVTGLSYTKPALIAYSSSSIGPWDFEQWNKDTAAQSRKLQAEVKSDEAR